MTWETVLLFFFVFVSFAKASTVKNGFNRAASVCLHESMMESDVWMLTKLVTNGLCEVGRIY